MQEKIKIEKKYKGFVIAFCYCVISLFSISAQSAEIQTAEMTRDDRTPILRYHKSSLNSPGAEDWKDKQGNFAPPLVRRAADDLWESVKVEGEAAFNAGWGMGKKMPCGPRRICFCCITLGILECCMACCGEYEKFGWNAQFRAAHRPEERIYEQRIQDVNRAFSNFKEAVNSSVQNPVQYSGDINIGNIGEWVEDGCWQYDGGLFVSGRRELGGVFQRTLAFVNSHGGWVNQDSQF